MRFKIVEAYQTHAELNQKLFDGDKLRPDVRDAISHIADSFGDYAKSWDIPLKVIDVWMVGSNASYNYSDKSDIDVHLIVNMSGLNYDESIMSIVYNLIRSSYNKAHDITIKGMPVEVYVEDVNTSSVTNGIYSINKNEWIKHPVEMEIVDIDVKNTDTYKKYASKANEVQTEEEIQSLIDDLYLLRKESLISDGEEGEGNLVFKELRNDGILDSLKDRLVQAEDKKLTLESLLNEVYPNKGESKEDFIKRFMSVTKDEYPDRKQRYAVALSYWDRRNKKK